jgi:mannose/cellobiose epimerase-like protein (N-acyl-D-glucosamine 2-epimerase family)
MHIQRSLFIIFTAVFLFSCTGKKADAPDVLKGKYWKDQAINNIVPAWTRYSQNERSGTFYTNLDSLWQPFGSAEIYPSMISRHLFGYSVAYLLSGNDEYIKIADRTFRWLIDKAWDKEFGGWYDALDEAGNPTLTTKTTFVQVYAITGLTLYYFVTHDSSALSYIEKSNDILEQKVWDRGGSGGYYNVMNRDWSINDSNKSFSSEITPVSGYLIYLYLATKDQKFQDQINRILEMVTFRMVDRETGWVLEDFDRDWNYIRLKQDASEISVGHNIEATWMLLKNYLLTSDQIQKESGLAIADKLRQTGVFNKHNVWLSNTSRTNLSEHSADSYWWIQAYGNMISLFLYETTGNKDYLADFKRGAELWDSCFVDRRHGDTFFRIDSTGKVLDATKAGRFKASYHNMEHCLLNYLCLNMWVNKEPVEFHFRINSSEEGDLLYPVLIEDKDVRIEKAVNPAQNSKSLPVKDQSVVLPDGKSYKLDVVLMKE